MARQGETDQDVLYGQHLTTLDGDEGAWDSTLLLSATEATPARSDRALGDQGCAAGQAERVEIEIDPAEADRLELSDDVALADSVELVLLARHQDRPSEPLARIGEVLEEAAEGDGQLAGLAPGDRPDAVVAFEPIPSEEAHRALLVIEVNHDSPGVWRRAAVAS